MVDFTVTRGDGVFHIASTMRGTLTVRHCTCSYTWGFGTLGQVTEIRRPGAACPVHPEGSMDSQPAIAPGEYAVTGTSAIGMRLAFDDASPVAHCTTSPSTSSQTIDGACRWHGHGDSMRDAVTGWSAHVAAEHRGDWGE